MLLWFPHLPPALNPVFLQPKYYEESTGIGISRRGPGLWLVPACHDILQVTSERQLAAREETARASPFSQEGSEKLR